MYEDISFVKELANTKRTITEQEEEFINKTRKSRATFYRYRKKLGLRSKHKRFEYGGSIKEICYFCLNKATLIHHINQNRKDNQKENLIPLCKGCHTKIHRVLNTIKYQKMRTHSLTT